MPPKARLGAACVIEHSEMVGSLVGCADVKGCGVKGLRATGAGIPHHIWWCLLLHDWDARRGVWLIG